MSAALQRQSENTCQVPVQLGQRRSMKPTGGCALQTTAIDETRVINLRRRGGIQASLLGRKRQVNRVLGRRASQGDDGYQRAAGRVVGVGRNNDDRSSRALLVALYRIESAPEDLAPLDHQFSSGKSDSEVFSQTVISAFARASSSGSAASRAKASCTSDQKTRSSISCSARWMTCALGWPNFEASFDSVATASPAMRTLVATVSISQFYHEPAIRPGLRAERRGVPRGAHHRSAPPRRPRRAQEIAEAAKAWGRNNDIPVRRNS